jgi:ferredoxin
VRVWIDQDLCTGDGLCTDHAPEVFTLLEDGIAYVKQHGRVLNDPGGSGSLALVPASLNQAATHAAMDCPGECIFIEIERELPSVG